MSQRKHEYRHNSGARLNSVYIAVKVIVLNIFIEGIEKDEQK